MKARWKVIAIAVVAIAIVGSLAGIALAAGPWWNNDAGRQNGSSGRGGAGGGTTAATATLDSDVEEQLLFLREEEKLAHDVYAALYDTWGEAVFTNIATSESRHMESVKNLLDRYGLDDPVGDNEAGVFADPDLQALYYDLVVQGSASLQDAYNVGVTIEEMDIADLNELLETNPDLPRDVTRVAGRLLNGSESHLAAFNSLLQD